jgi:hypothetical protein
VVLVHETPERVLITLAQSLDQAELGGCNSPFYFHPGEPTAAR